MAVTRSQANYSGIHVAHEAPLLRGYNRYAPSPRYVELLRQYEHLHREGEHRLGLPAQETFPGVSLLPHVQRIKARIDQSGSRSVLDYGCGKGLQYTAVFQAEDDPNDMFTITGLWGLDRLYCYDPCYAPFSRLPSGRFDGVICTDVLEHCPEADVAWIVNELFSYADRFLYANIACYPASKTLPNGENAHCTIQPPEWWRELFNETALRYPWVKWEAWVQYRESILDETLDGAQMRTGGRQTSNELWMGNWD